MLLYTFSGTAEAFFPGQMIYQMAFPTVYSWVSQYEVVCCASLVEFSRFMTTAIGEST